MLLGALLLSIWPFYVVPPVAETVASEVALSKPWNREANPISGDIRPVQYVFRAAGAAAWASVDEKLDRSGKHKAKWIWRSLYVLGNGYLVYNSLKRLKEPSNAGS